MSLRRYEEIKSLIEVENEIKKFATENGKTEIIPEIHQKYTERIREKLRYIDRNYIDPLGKPITEKWRTIVPDKEDIAISGYDYCVKVVDDPDDWTDEEIEEFIMDEVGYPPICEPWDCTGKRFTRWCSWNRQPIGIVMIHAWGTDL